MGKLYERADLYDLLDSEPRFRMFERNWEAMLDGKDVRTLLDVSIGSGSATLPAARLGIKICGSDLSEAMLARCRKKAEAMGVAAELKQADFRDLSCWEGRLFDCVASTGNALPYVSNDDVLCALRRMDTLVRPGGYLCFDVRNWDKILRERQRFYLYNPIFDGDTRVNMIQFWDYNSDGSMTFNICYTFERENRIVGKEIFEERYNPVPQTLLLGRLRQMGYESIEVRGYPHRDGENIEEVEWYSVIARKMRETGE